MSTAITKSPDTLSFSGNLKPFEITASSVVLFELYKDTKLILNENYHPNADNFLSINVKSIIEQLLSVSIPANLAIINEQTSGVGYFMASVDGQEF